MCLLCCSRWSVFEIVWLVHLQFHKQLANTDALGIGAIMAAMSVKTFLVCSSGVIVLRHRFDKFCLKILWEINTVSKRMRNANRVRLLHTLITLSKWRRWEKKVEGGESESRMRETFFCEDKFEKKKAYESTFNWEQKAASCEHLHCCCAQAASGRRLIITVYLHRIVS